MHPVSIFTKVKEIINNIRQNFTSKLSEGLLKITKFIGYYHETLRNKKRKPHANND